MPPPKSLTWDHLIPGTKQKGSQIFAYSYDQKETDIDEQMK